MMILALDSSSRTASVALCHDGELLGECFNNNGLTHSHTLMPMVESLLENTHADSSAIDVVAVTHGPGSFTGLRIGVSSAAGLAWGWGKPCCGVSSLEAAAMGLAHLDGTVVCAVMDARCGQVYNALFLAMGNALRRLTPDRAISLDDLWGELQKKNPILVGDGAEMCYNHREEHPAKLAPPHLRHPSAWSVAHLADLAAHRGQLIPADKLSPVYLRVPQAERERSARLAAQKP